VVPHNQNNNYFIIQVVEVCIYDDKKKNLVKHIVWFNHQSRFQPRRNNKLFMACICIKSFKQPHKYFCFWCDIWLVKLQPLRFFSTK